MRYIADLHIHSYYSRATSKQLNLEHLNKWAQLKGLTVVATGDITHPKWLEEMRQKLEPSAPGFFKLKSKYAQELANEIYPPCSSDVHFILSGEISSIYKKGDKVRKVHNVAFMPSFEAVEKFQARLERIGNIRSDGRPILGLDSRDLLEIMLETDDNAQLIPAHIWTPWFSMMGSKSGFDTVEECFDDLSHHIFAVETGLSSDPPMNWRLSMLDKYALVSNSDAHSPAKLAREANIFDTDLSYDGLFNALKNKNSENFWGTLEFFPEEGKYHMDGHRSCKLMMRPSETIQRNGLCPVCGKKVTIGVSYRVEELADRPEGEKPSNAKPFLSLIPLPEVLSEVFGVGPNSKRVQTQYLNMLREIGPEIDILINKPLDQIEKANGPLIAEAIKRMREGKVNPQPGYDGEFGIIRIFDQDEREKIIQQGTLFSIPSSSKDKNANSEQPIAAPETSKKKIKANKVKEAQTKWGLNEQQQQAVNQHGGVFIIKAGPGTGKTFTLTHRIAQLVKTGFSQPNEILTITFTNKAAKELRQRLAKLVGKNIAEQMTISTFHAFGVQLLRNLNEPFSGRNNDFSILGPKEDENFIKDLSNAFGHKISKSKLETISRLKAQLITPDDIPKELLENLSDNFSQLYQAYEKKLVENNLVDYDDLINLPVQILRKNPEVRRAFLKQYSILAVDEFQDINRAQYELFKVFAIAAKDVCVIGDPDQSIYGFRGASPEFFLGFKKDFPSAKSIQLEQNYRSSQNILSASRQMLCSSHNVDKQDLWSNLSSDVKIQIQTSATDKAEAEFIVHQIEQLVGGTSHFSIDSKRVDDRVLPQDFVFSDFSILLRTKRLLPLIEEAFNRSGIPYNSFSESSYLENPLVSKAYLLLQQRLANQQKSLGKKQSPDELKPIFKTLVEFPQDEPVVNLVQFLFEKLGKLFPDEQNDSLRQIIQYSRSFENRLGPFLDALVLKAKSDDYEKGDRVSIFTLHASKGLEFPVVFIPGCEDGLIPLKFGSEEFDMDEERRLLYVGMTRAQSRLYLTHAKSRLVYGQKTKQEPSPFLAAISESLIKQGEQMYTKNIGVNQLKLF